MKCQCGKELTENDVCPIPTGKRCHHLGGAASAAPLGTIDPNAILAAGPGDIIMVSPPAPTGHSRFGASKSERWLKCPGSVKAEHGLPDNTSDYAKEGTALHAIASHCLESGQDAEEWIDRTFKYDDHGTASEIEPDEEQAEAVQTYLDEVRGALERTGGTMLIEARFALGWLHPEFFGTSDCAILGNDAVLRVFDAKFGRGVGVEAAGNSQLAYYALGAVEEFKRQHPDKDIAKIELNIVQPRLPRALRTSPLYDHTDLLELAQDLVEAAAEADGPNPRFAAGPHCKFCKAAATCRVLRDFAVDTAQLDFDDETGIVKTAGELTVNPLEMSPQAVANALEAAETIRSWINAVEMHALRLAEVSYEIPGWKLVARRARRKWLGDETTTANALCLEHGLDESSIYAKKLLSPAQIDKLVKKKDRKQFEPLYERKSSGNVLARVDDVRPETRPTAQSDFDDGQGEAEAAEW